MLSLDVLKKKIKTAQDLLSVVKTMKSLAAVNIRHYESAAVSLERYSKVVGAGWQALFRTPLQMLPAVDEEQMIFLVFGSDQGMCGQFNEVIANLAAERFRSEQAAGRRVAVWTAGERVRAALENLHVIDEYFALPGGPAGIPGQVQEVVRTFEQRRNEKGVEVLEVFYNQLVAGGYESVRARILPLDSRWVERHRLQKWPNKCLPLLGMAPGHLFRELFRQYLFVSFYKAFAQSLASENAARLRSMQAAEKNIQELEETLEARFRETRQNIITSELLDIISGFEAVSGKSSQGPLKTTHRKSIPDAVFAEIRF